MTQQRQGIGTTLIVVALVLVIVVGTIGFVMLNLQSLPLPRTTSDLYSQSSTSLASTTGPSVSYSTTSSSDLRLQVTLNSSSIQSQEEVAVQIEVLNLQSQNVSLTVVPNQNISSWNAADFFCSVNPSRSLVGFALFSGNFASGNISAAGSPLQLAASSVVLPCLYSLPLNDTTFLPGSDKTVSLSYYGQTEEPPYQVTAEVDTSTGYCGESLTAGACRGPRGSSATGAPVS